MGFSRPPARRPVTANAAQPQPSLAGCPLEVPLTDRSGSRSASPGLPDDETPADQRDTWVFYLGPDNLGIDDENLYVKFDREGRATAITTNAAKP
jgi:hypothetical protein